MQRAVVAWLVCGGVLIASGMNARAEGACVFINADGAFEQAKTLSAVPSQFRSRAACNDRDISEVAEPKRVDVGPDTRTASFVTDLGPMAVRWSRTVEECLGRSPARAVGEAARVVTKALRSGRFTADVRYARREWQLVFIDKAAALSQFPLDLTVNQHPGFMIPPHNIYLVSDFIAPGCVRSNLSEEALQRVLLHEMGHVIEYIILGEQSGIFDRERAEGFATWFEYYAMGRLGQLGDAYRSAVPRRRDERDLSSKVFRGTREDYLGAAVRQQAIVDKRGVSGLMSVYTVIRDRRIDFDAAVHEASAGINPRFCDR